MLGIVASRCQARPAQPLSPSIAFFAARWPPKNPPPPRGGPRCSSAGRPGRRRRAQRPSGRRRRAPARTSPVPSTPADEVERDGPARKSKANGVEPSVHPRVHACTMFPSLSLACGNACCYPHSPVWQPMFQPTHTRAATHTLPCGDRDSRAATHTLPCGARDPRVATHTLPCGNARFSHALVREGVEDHVATHTLPCGNRASTHTSRAATHTLPCGARDSRVATHTLPCGNARPLPTCVSCGTCTTSVCTLHNAIPVCRLCVVVCGPTLWSLVRAHPCALGRHNNTWRNGLVGGNSTSSFCQARETRAPESLFWGSRPGGGASATLSARTSVLRVSCAAAQNGYSWIL